MNWKNKTIFIGDNLHIMRGMNSDSVDLIYLDPPFNSNRNYAAPIGSQAAGAAFKDTWTLNDIDIAEHGELAEQAPPLHTVIQAAREAHGKGMQSYLIMMSTRLLEMERILKNTGSIYLHCDSTASHYLKMVMDTVFGKDNFRNEVIWKRTSAHNDPGRFGRIHDTLLFYVKGSGATWNLQHEAHEESYIAKSYRHQDAHGRYRVGDLTGSETRTGESGEPWRDLDPTDIGRHWAVPSTGAYAEYIEKHFIPNYRQISSVHDRLNALDETGLIYWPDRGTMPSLKRYLNASPGRPLQDIIVDINQLGSTAKERTGYPTQKPLALLERIIKASSNPGDIVFDPFCGCATTLVAADRLQRSWVGIDISPKAAELVVDRIKREQGLFQNIIARDDYPSRTDMSDIPPARTHKHTLYGLQEGICGGCEIHFPFRNLTIDHKIPRSKGGTDHFENLWLLCGACNSLKGTGTVAELRARLERN